MNQNTDMPKSEPNEQVRQKRRSGEGKKDAKRRLLFFTVDAVLVLAIVAAILFFLSVLTPFSLSRTNRAEKRTVSYTVELPAVENAMVNTLHVGDTVTDEATGAVIGTVTAVDIRAYETFGDLFEYDTALGSNVVTRIEYPETLNTVTLTITVTAEYTAGVGYTAGECRIAVGRTYTLRFPEYTGSGSCISFLN